MADDANNPIDLLAVEQSDWDEVRFTLLRELSSLDVPDFIEQPVHAMLVALTDVYDRPLPNYTVYRQLRTFLVARWPLLKNLLKPSHASLIDQKALIGIVEQVTLLAQHAIAATEQSQADSLQVDMTVLTQLLESSATG